MKNSRNLSDDEFIHELSLRDDPISKRAIKLLDDAKDKVAAMLDEIEEADRLMTLGEELNDWLCRLPEGAMEYLEGVVEDYEQARIWVCVDCLMVIANDDWPEVDQGRLQEIEDGLESLGNPTPGERVREFSRAPCDCCGTHLAGTRHEAFEVNKIR